MQKEETTTALWVLMPVRLPPGCHFVPTEDELVLYYLKNKVLEVPMAPEMIKEIKFSELFKRPPSDLVSVDCVERDWYWFLQIGEEFGEKGNEIQKLSEGEGFWKFMGKPYPLVNDEGEAIAMKKDLVFLKRQTETSKPKKTHWTMEIYHMSTELCNCLDVDQQQAKKWSLVNLRRGKCYIRDE